MNPLGLAPAVADRRRVHPALWTLVGALVGSVAGFGWADPLQLGFNWDYVSLGLVAGVFASVVAAVWPGGRAIPTEACPRCGGTMPWNVVVCPECGEIR
jgi:hypothetical protein